ncbi:MAG: hypothetical protein ABR573_07115 [Candidatus Dormibacteria bacterium]
MTRPHTVDMKAVAAILAEARQQEAEVLSSELPTSAAMKKLGRVELQELDGSLIPMTRLWETRPAAIVFLRHYG